MAATRTDYNFPTPRSDIRAVSASELWAASAARTADGNSGLLGSDYDRFSSVVVQVDATVVSGTTPSLVCNIQDSLDGTNWNTIASSVALTAVGRQIVRVPVTTPFSPLLRLAWVITGTTPSFTFTVRAFLRGI